ncbi:MAG: SsrA-binding protein [Candidatus Marinimicrobia bacterium]|nr:SsrA-binding protein [Candidatus Neomarinimicrobiota bacterium]|tara:strand:+ start:8007 stop:8465 length:459 start_codon:yes stop_codon:yes gene_type:complete
MKNNANNISTNRKAFYEYDILKKYEAGIVLKGSEVKSIRENNSNIKEAYIRVKDDEIFIIGMNIAKYSHEGYSTHDPDREKKLLLHKNEIQNIKEEVEEKGKTIIPLNLYYKNGKVKIQFAIAKGRKLWDKRNYKKDQDVNREIDRAMKDIK